MMLAVTWDSGTLQRLGQESLAAALQLGAALGTGVAVAALGDDSEAVAASATAYGPTRVFAFKGRPATEPAIVALEGLVREIDARYVLLTDDERGAELGPRLAERLLGTAITHVLGVEVDEGRVTWTRPVFGGKALAAVRAVAEPVVATLRPGVFGPLEERGGSVVVETRELPEAGDAVELIEVSPPAEGIGLDEASVVVAGGRGLGDAEAFTELEELAGLLGGAVGASLAAVDAGWAPGERQVGLTGKSVSPAVYFAIGISGASQHLAGIGGAQAVVAVNTDQKAPIFGAARLGVVMDCRTFVPALIEELRGRAP